MTSSSEINDFESTYLNGSKSRLSISGQSDTLRDLLGERKFSVDSLHLDYAEKEADEFMKQMCRQDDESTTTYDNDVKTTRNIDVYKVNSNAMDINGNRKQNALASDINKSREILLVKNDMPTRLNDCSSGLANKRNNENTLSHIHELEEDINHHSNEHKDNDSTVLVSKKREITKQLSDTNQLKYLNQRKKDLNFLQERYSQAIEDFKILRSNLSENMERNLSRTEQLGFQHKKADHYRSYDDILRNNFDMSSRTQSDVAYLRNKNIERYSSQERLYKRRSDINIDEKLTDEYFNNPSRFTNNNIDMKGHTMMTSRGNSSDYPMSIDMQREHHIHLRDQAARSNFERYLRGSLNQGHVENSMHNNSNGLEEHDIGYGGSGSTSPRDSEMLMPSDQLSSRSGSINSHHSRTSSALASVDSGVRMSFVGQHNSLVVVAIDFGTTFSGYAFSFTRDSSSIHMMRRWEGGDPGVTNQKTPTTLLLKPDGSFHSFGFGARDFYHDLDASDAKKWFYFDKFKMALHSSEDLHAGIEIKAANGKSYPALKVFSHALRFFKQHVLAELSDQSTAKLSEEDITWVLTVPAIWRQPAKQFMRTAAYEAGIASLDHPDRLLIALEPEAASIFCRKLRIRDCVIEDDLKAKAGDYSLISEDFEGITQYVVVDCGGGTVDLTVHELDVTQGTLKELHKGTGGPCGATGVDREFEKLLKRIFDADFIERFKVKRPAVWIDLMISFEAKKRTARPDNQSPLNLSLPFSFIEYHKKHRKCSVETAVKKFKNPDIKWSSQGMLRFSANIMQALFEPVVNDIIGHIQNLLTKASLKHVEHLFLVGGFAESPLLQSNIREALEGRVRVVIPNDVGLAILKGAVLFGLDPTVVRVRRSAYTYGVGVLNKFDPEKHQQSKRVVKDGIVWCKDIFDRFVRVDESVGIGDRVTRSYAPARSKQKSTVINIYCTEKLDVLYTTDKGVTRCGKLRIEMPDVNPEDIPIEKRGKPRELQASMIFGDTEIKVSAVDVLSGRAARANIDFLNY